MESMRSSGSSGSPSPSAAMLSSPTLSLSTLPSSSSSALSTAARPATKTMSFCGRSAPAAALASASSLRSAELFVAAGLGSASPALPLCCAPFSAVSGACEAANSLARTVWRADTGAAAASLSLSSCMACAASGSGGHRRWRTAAQVMQPKQLSAAPLTEASMPCALALAFSTAAAERSSSAGAMGWKKAKAMNVVAPTMTATKSPTSLPRLQADQASEGRHSSQTPSCRA